MPSAETRVFRVQRKDCEASEEVRERQMRERGPLFRLEWLVS